MSINISICDYNYLLMQPEAISNVDMPKATLKIEESTRDRLKKLGTMEDTYDTVINRLIDEHEQNKKE